MKGTISSRRPVREWLKRAAAPSLTACLALFLSACAATDDDPHPPMSESDRMSLQGECVKIADNSQREACLERARTDTNW